MMGKVLLTIDGFINLALGLMLLIFPQRMVSILGLPIPSTNFYVNILGGVLVGISLALFLHSRLGGRGLEGLGIQGAVVINLCGAGVLLTWLLSGKLDMPRSGSWFLWGIVILVFMIAAGEILFWFRNRNRKQAVH